MSAITIYFDGACEPRNPGGIATCGFVILNNTGAEIYSDCREVARGQGATNNVAEWCALGLALRAIDDSGLVQETGATEIVIYGDSMLVVNQLNGTWQCRADRMAKLRNRCLELLRSINIPWKAHWIPREKNERADSLSRRAYEEATRHRFPIT